MPKPSETESFWLVVRQDTHGNEFIVREGLSEADATALSERFNAKGHKQHFRVERAPYRPQARLSL